ncbi:MAG: hypothetical protein LUG44_00290, partial [Clostridiales bacterium]|nr:hypothetical protein [Clostridiales bacterium]
MTLSDEMSGRVAFCGRACPAAESHGNQACKSCIGFPNIYNHLDSIKVENAAYFIQKPVGAARGRP